MLAPLLFAAALTSPAPAPGNTPEISFTRFTLDNGLEVIVHEDHKIPVVAVDVWVHVGAGDESAGKTGFAHLFEHMMFQGSQNVPEDKHFDILREAGGSSINGTTNFDRTNYFEVVPTNQIETALWLESDRLGLLLDHVNQKSLDTQIEVVRNERRQRYDNVPYGAARFALFESAYPVGHPYRHLVIGKHEDLERASLEDVRGFFKKWYVPANATLALAGDIDAKTARALAEKWFGGLPKSPRPEHKVPSMPVLQESVRKEISDAFAKLTRVQMSWHAPKRFSDDDADLATLADVLGHDGWGRMYKLLVVEKQVAQSVAVYQEPMGFSSLFTVAVTLKPGVDVPTVEGLVRRELLRMLDKGPTEAEVKRSVVDTETNLLFSLDEIMSRAEQLQTFNHFTGDPGYLPRYLAQIRSRTPESVRLAARKWLAKPRVEIVTVPGGAK
jgi:zinc protease